MCGAELLAFVPFAEPRAGQPTRERIAWEFGAKTSLGVGGLQESEASFLRDYYRDYRVLFLLSTSSVTHLRG